MWSINAAKKKDDDIIPGSSKWIRVEVLNLHDQMLADLEQIAYDVAADFAWIDEQMKEVLHSTELNPRLLLESPLKLRELDSPVKKIRSEALSTLRSPLRSQETHHISIVSPIRTRSNLHKDSNLIPSQNFTLFQSPLRNTSPINPEHSFFKSSTPITKKHSDPSIPNTEQTKKADNKQTLSFQPIDRPAFSSTPESKEHFNSEGPAFSSTPEPVSLHAPLHNIKTPNDALMRTSSHDVTIPESPNKENDLEITKHQITESTITNAQMLLSQSDHVDLPLKDPLIEPRSTTHEEFIDVNDNSLQAIRAAIRKNIMRKSSKSTTLQASDSESSYRSAQGDKSQDISKDSVKEKSKLVEFPTSASTIRSSRNIVLNSTTKASFKDEQPLHSTPVKQKYSQRESQGFGLMTQNQGSLSVKQMEITTMKGSISKESLNEKDKSASPTIFSKTFFPTATNLSLPSSNPTLNLSPIAPSNQEKLVLTESMVKPSPLKRSRTELTKTEATDLSPLRKSKSNSHKLSFSPLSDLFASVGTALRSVGRPTKAPASLLDKNDDPKKSNKNIFANVSRNIDFKEGSRRNPAQKILNTNVRRSAVFSGFEDIFQSKPTDTSIVEGNKKKHQVRIELTDNDNSDGDVDEDELSKNVWKLSPVRSIWAPPTRGTQATENESLVLNSTDKKPSVRTDQSRSSDFKQEPDLESKMSSPPAQRKSSLQQPQLVRSSTRVSLSNYGNFENRANAPPRKSYVKSGGLTSMPLDGKLRTRPVSQVFNEHQISTKKPTLEEHQQYYQQHQPNSSRKITNNQPSTYQKSMGLKRKSLEQTQGMWSKKASRISQEPTLPDHKEENVIKSNHSSKLLIGRSLTKTALLNYDNNEKGTLNSKRSPSMTKTGPKRLPSVVLKTPPKVKPSATDKVLSNQGPAALPEIYSGSEAEEDNSVLMSWAESPYLRQQLLTQQRTIDPDKMFGEIPPLNMEEIFGSSVRMTKLQKKRGSSAK